MSVSAVSAHRGGDRFFDTAPEISLPSGPQMRYTEKNDTRGKGRRYPWNDNWESPCIFRRRRPLNRPRFFRSWEWPAPTRSVSSAAPTGTSCFGIWCPSGAGSPAPTPWRPSAPCWTRWRRIPLRDGCPTPTRWPGRCCIRRRTPDIPPPSGMERCAFCSCSRSCLTRSGPACPLTSGWTLNSARRRNSPTAVWRRSTAASATGSGRNTSMRCSA